MESQQLPHGGVFDIPAFCTTHKISRALLYKLIREGKGPRLIKAGRRTLISYDAAQEWRERMTAPAAQSKAA